MNKLTQNKIGVTLLKILPHTNDTQKNMHNIYICPNLQNSKMEEITKIHYESSTLKLSIMKPSQNLTLKHSKCQISLQFNTISIKPWQTVATKHVKWTHITSTFSIEVVKRENMKNHSDIGFKKKGGALSKPKLNCLILSLVFLASPQMAISITIINIYRKIHIWFCIVW